MIHPDPYDHLGDLLADALVQFKRETALIELNRERISETLTYTDVKQQTTALTQRMAEAGVGPGDRVAIVMSNQSRWLMTACAVFFRGAVLVPLDYKLSAREQAALLEHSRPKLLVTEWGFLKRFNTRPTLPTWVVDVPQSADLGDAERWDDLPTNAPPVVVQSRSREDVATIVYSSGTGGEPKGCMLPHRAYLSQLGALLGEFTMDRGDRYFSILPTNHAIDFMVGFVGPFVCGATVVHQRSLRPEFLRSTLKTQQITHMAVVPILLDAFKRSIDDKLDALSPWRRTAFNALVATNKRLTQKQPNHAVSARLLKPIHDAFGGTLKLLFAGGAFVDPGKVGFFYDLGLPVVVGYGLTEACTVLTVNRLDPFRSDSVGRAVDGVQLRIANADAHGIGEVQAKGPTLMLGYLDDAEQTAAAFTEDGWLRTGDLGRFDASFHLHLLGRSKNMIVTAGGKNVYPEDVEALLEDVPAEELCVVAANYVWPKQTMTDEQLIAVIRTDKASETLAALRSQNRRLPEHKRISGVLLWDDEFPRTASMKLKRPVLATAIRDSTSADAVSAL
ncbi:MAG: long-chain acyl-CoA synthetase [Myxococcota bacterium]